jgi:hypothetical protein
MHEQHSPAAALAAVPHRHHPSAAGAFERWAAEYMFSPFRWLGTVVLECALGTFFLVAPWMTLDLLGAEGSSTAAVLFQIYGALLIHRGLTQQVFYRQRDLRLFRRLLWASFPFSIGSTLVLGLGVHAGLMSPLVGWIVVATFAFEIVDNGVLLWATRRLVTAGSRIESPA